MPGSMHRSGYFDGFGGANVESNAASCFEGSKEEASGAGASAPAGWEEGSAIGDGISTIEVNGLEPGVEEVVATPVGARDAGAGAESSGTFGSETGDSITDINPCGAYAPLAVGSGGGSDEAGG
jgi:hypothetical protein